MEATAAPVASYRALLHVPGFPRLALATLLVRAGASMWQLALVLFVLQRYGSPSLAGISVFLAIAPGVLVSPIAGALLDRFGRVRLMVSDYAVSAAALTGIVVLANLHAPLPAILALVVVGSLMNPLGTSGSRSLFPMVIPPRLWDRANAVDSMFYMVTTVLGPPLAGAIVAFSSPEAAIAATAAVFLAGALTLTAVRDVYSARDDRAGLLTEARAGVLYVLRNRALRGLAVGMSVVNLGQGILIVALPVLVLERGYGGAQLVGALWSLMGLCGIASGLLAGRWGSEGRERPMLAGGILGIGSGIAAIATTSSLDGVVAGVALVGMGSAVMDVALFSLRQRVTDPAWFGRAFAVSMHLNYSGIPIGSALSGPLLAISTPLALTAAVGFALLAAVLTWVMVPSTERA
ncbi:MAG TPA: MFS transporter [Candidatus Limnocylindria bacterium]|nr:MFS transporter [Candidatus Limnocylindria bacterium]